MLKKSLGIIAILALLIGPLALVLLPGVNFAASFGAGSRAPNVIATTLAFDNGHVVTVHYSQIYFCNNGFGQNTSTASNPCKVGIDSVSSPIPDHATGELDVIVPAFLGLSTSGGIFDPSLGGNIFTQCPDNTVALTCPNHPTHLDLTPSGLGGNAPLPIHSHVIGGSGASGTNAGGWWDLKVFLITNSTVWPNPVTGACTAGTGCVTSYAALANAVANGQAEGPVPSTVYLFFNVVSNSTTK